METNLEWEPHPFELAEMNGRTYEKEIESLGELWLIENLYLKNRNFMQELAEEAWYRFVTIYSKNPKTPNLFLESVVSVLPQISDRIKDKREIMIMLVKDVASRLGTMLAENRRKRKEREKNRSKRRCSYAQTKAKRIASQALARDILEHGTYHGELLLPGIQTRYIPQKRTHKTTWPKRKKRHAIPSHEQLGSIVGQVDNELFIRDFGTQK